MNPIFFRLAAGKTTDPVALAMLAELERITQALAQAEATFVDRINANKIRRGEGPTRLSRARAAQLQELSEDQIDIERGLCAQFAQAHHPSFIVAAVDTALSLDLPNARKFLAHYHPDDLPLGRELVELKTLLKEKTSAFLAAYPNEDA